MLLEKIKKNLTELDEICIVDNDQTYTYRDLEIRSCEIKTLLKLKKIQKGDVVAIFLDKGFDFIASIIAVIRHGAVYLPLDINHPKERVLYMLEDSNAKIVLTNKFTSTFIKNIAIVSSVDINEVDNTSAIASEWSDLEKSDIYQIYTSGTTGKPKGIKIKYEALSNFVISQSQFLKFDNKSVVAHLSSVCFDMSVWEIFLALYSSSKIIVFRKDDVIDAKKFIKKINSDQITHMISTPSILSLISEDSLDSLKHVVSAGEKCSEKLLKKWIKRCDFYDAYGATEATIYTTIINKTKGKFISSVGFAMENTRVLIENSENKILEVGEGEIIISGIGVQNGYHNRSELNLEKFFVLNNEKCYRTGDFGLIDDSGALYYMGRKDRQVKVNGLRIELEEVENKANMINGVLASYAHIKEGNNLLVLHVLPNKENFNDLNVKYIKEELLNFLPKEMIPSLIIILKDHVSLTSSGKIDVSKLPVI